MHKISFVFYCVAIMLISVCAHSFSSSSYLIANSAMLLFDYEEAFIHYQGSNLRNFSNEDLEKKLLAYVNTNSLNKASIVAKEILQHDKKNQEAWLVILTEAKINHLDKPFYNFEKQNEIESLDMIKFIFYNNFQLKNNNYDIAQSIFDIVQTSSRYGSNQLQNYDYLLFYLSLSINLNQKFDEAYFYSAQLYQKLKNYKKAEKNYNKVNKDHKLYLESQKNIAINKSFESKPEEAEKNLIRLLKINGKNKDLLFSVANFYRSSKQFEKAIPYYSKIINDQNIDNEEKWAYLYLRGICYEKENNWQLAEEDFIHSLEINFESPQVLNYLAYGWIERNIFLDRSLEMLKKAYEKNPDSHYILDSLAWAYFKKEDFEIASKLMEEVTIMAPGEAISLDHLGDIYFAMGREREAIYMWKQANDLAEPEDNIIGGIKKKLEMYDAG